MLNLFLTYIVPASTLFPIIVFVTRKGVASRPLKVIFTYLVVAITVNVIGTAMSKFGLHNLWLLHIYTVLETVILLFFFTLILHGRRAKAVVWFLLIAFPLACIVNLLFLQNASVFNTYTRSVEALLIIGVSAYYWLYGSKETLDVRWTANPLNWVISGLLLYFASALFLFLFSNFVLSARQTNPKHPIWDIVWVTHGFLLMIMYVLFAVAFIKSKNDR